MHINTGCSLAVSVAIALAAAAPLVLPINTLPVSVQGWVTGLLALAGIALNSFRVWQESQSHDLA